jgi:hypothetical protein
VISSIKQHLPHLPHGHKTHSHSSASASSEHSSEFDQSRHHTSAHHSVPKPHSSSSGSVVTVERPHVDAFYPATSSSNKTSTYSNESRPVPPPVIVSETKIIKEIHTVLPAHAKSSTSLKKTVSIPDSKSSSSSSASSISDDDASSVISSNNDNKNKMVKYDSYDSYENSHAGHGHHHNDRSSVSEVEYKVKEYKTGGGPISSVHAPKATTFTIPCHHIRIGDLVILQHRPCQIIRITTSAQTGQHRYLGVDLFTKQLHEEPCVVSHPSPSVVLHSLLGPVFKQYRLIDIRDDGKLVAMTETGEIKQGLKVVDQGHLWSRLKEAFGRGSGSVRVLVIADQGKELAVDYKTVHLSHKL